MRIVFKICEKYVHTNRNRDSLFGTKPAANDISRQFRDQELSCVYVIQFIVKRILVSSITTGLRAKRKPWFMLHLPLIQADTPSLNEFADESTVTSCENYCTTRHRLCALHLHVRLAFSQLIKILEVYPKSHC